MARASFLLPLSLLLACSDGGSSTAPSTAAQLDAYCQNYCGWKNRCKQTEINGCVQGCLGELGPTVGRFLGTFIEVAGKCFSTHPCNQGDDPCIAAGVAAINPNPGDTPDAKECLAVRDTCKAQNVQPISDDYCYQLPALTSATLQAFKACYAKPCAEQGACVRSATGS